MLDEMYNQGKPEHRKKGYYKYFENYKIEIIVKKSVNPLYKKIVFNKLGLKLLVFISNSHSLLQHLQGCILVLLFYSKPSHAKAINYIRCAIIDR